MLHGPRLLYLAGVGLAVLWSALWPRPQSRLLGRGAWAFALGFVLVTNWGFVRAQLLLYDELTSPVDLAREVMHDRPAGEGILLVNLPEWRSPVRNTYPVGSEHVAMMGHHLFVEELVEENLGTSRPVRAIQLPELLSQPDYPYAAFGETDLSRPIRPIGRGPEAMSLW